MLPVMNIATTREFERSNSVSYQLQQWRHRLDTFRHLFSQGALRLSPFESPLQQRVRFKQPT
ncbi:unnamed protein product [Brassica rapa subsp. narinosa]